MALLSPRLQRFLSAKLARDPASRSPAKAAARPKSRCCSAIAIDAPPSLAEVSGVRWGYASLQGAREEMEDDVVVRTEGLDGYSFAAVFDGHGGFASAKFLRDELFKECVMSLQGGLVLSKQDINSIQEALREAFANADAKLVNWLETTQEEDESGSTATAIFLGSDKIFIAHVGDSCVVLSRSGKPEVLTNPHRPYGSSKVSLNEIRRIREAGGWVSNGRICGDISVSRAFGDIRYKTKKIEMLQKGVKEGRWSEKFISRIQFNGDLVIASPDIYQVALGSDAEFIVLASDGLWDYMNSSDAIEFVRNQLRQHGNVQLASEALAEAALDRRSQDNITIVIAELGRTDWRNLPVQRPNVVFEFGQAFATVGLVSLGIWMFSLLS
ncbi:protein phosphatase 2C 57 [Syzygium oleosum]|uniref:protein phosphatase 2C 57 n=1 Tax=Syzygium oleosum TaxID=219896 RepID=UPI0011D24557|nr:protein phosphatase 2C 57 [Syzygium oleosum]